jgi:hypothetical protein
LNINDINLGRQQSIILNCPLSRILRLQKKRGWKIKYHTENQKSQDAPFLQLAFLRMRHIQAVPLETPQKIVPTMIIKNCSFALDEHLWV